MHQKKKKTKLLRCSDVEHNSERPHTENRGQIRLALTFKILRCSRKTHVYLETVHQYNTAEKKFSYSFCIKRLQQGITLSKINDAGNFGSDEREIVSKMTDLM